MQHIEKAPIALGVAGTAYATTVLLMRYFTNESDRLLEGWQYLTGLACSIPLSLLLSRSNNSQKNLLAAGVCFAELALMRRMYVKLISGIPFAKVDLSGKVIIVTGSNAGLGFETAKELVRMGATVIMACRSPERANNARDTILRETKCATSAVMVMQLDLCSFDSVRKFVDDFHQRGLPLHCLINNAGVMMEDRVLTKDGLETVMTANHLSHFLLMNLLLPDLERTSGRIVNLTSSLHKIPKEFNFDDIMSEKSYNLFTTYAQSKLANVMVTLEMQRRLTAKGSKVTCNAAHPGLVRTEVTKNMNSFLQIGNYLAAPIMVLLQKLPIQGSYCSVHVATSPRLEGIGGLYFVDSVSTDMNPCAKDTIACQRLWEVSEQIIGFKSSL